MPQPLKHLRDFLSRQQMSGRHSESIVMSCILLLEQVDDHAQPPVIHVFDDAGILIGTIQEPQHVPQGLKQGQSGYE